jgi:hypothetical protein
MKFFLILVFISLPTHVIGQSDQSTRQTDFGLATAWIKEYRANYTNIRSTSPTKKAIEPIDKPMKKHAYHRVSKGDGSSITYNAWANQRKKNAKRRLTNTSEPENLVGLDVKQDVSFLQSKIQIQSKGANTTFLNYELVSSSAELLLAHKNSLRALVTHHWKGIAENAIRSKQRLPSGATYDVIVKPNSGKNSIKGTKVSQISIKYSKKNRKWEVSKISGALRRLSELPEKEHFQPLFRKTLTQEVALLEGRVPIELPKQNFPPFVKSEIADQVNLELSDPKLLPIRYGYEAVRHYVHEDPGYSARLGQILQTEYPFPFKKSLTISELKLRVREHMDLRINLMKLGIRLANKGAIASNRPRKKSYPSASQQKLANEVFWPAQHQISIDLIDILSRMPSNENGLEVAIELVELIQQTRSSQKWDHLLIWGDVFNTPSCGLPFRHPAGSYTRRQIRDPETTQEFCQIKKDEDFLLEAFRVGYVLRNARTIQNRLTNKGLKSNIGLLAFTFTAGHTKVMKRILTKPAMTDVFFYSKIYCLTKSCSSPLYQFVREQLGASKTKVIKRPTG